MVARSRSSLGFARLDWLRLQPIKAGFASRIPSQGIFYMIIV